MCILQLERTARFNFRALSLHRAAPTMKATPCAVGKWEHRAETNSAVPLDTPNLIPEKDHSDESSYDRLCCLIGCAGASAAQAGQPDGCTRYRCMAYGIAAETQLNSGFVAKGIWGIASDPHTIRDIANKTSPP